MLKKILILTSILFGLGMSSPSWSILIGTQEVGSIDTVIDSINKTGLTSSNPAGEELWAESVLGVDLTLSSALETEVSYIRDGNKIAFELVTGPGYYIVKNAKELALIQNEIDISWGVLDLDDEKLTNFSATLGDDFVISHVTEFDGAPVPEPVTLLLFGTGLLGFGAIRRKHKNNC